MNYEFDIFLSHASEDKDFVTLLYKELSKEYRVWYDKEQIFLGNKLSERIEQGLKNSKYGIVFLSDTYLAKDSKWIKKEFEEIVGNVNGITLPILHNIDLNFIKVNYQDHYELIENIRAISSIEDILKEVNRSIGEGGLYSQRNIDYTDLRNSLKLSNTTIRNAAQKTFELIKKIIQRSEINLNDELWDKDADFNTINRLWLTHTNGYLSLYDLYQWEGYATLEQSEKELIETIMKKQIYDIDKITVTGDKASYSNVDYTTLRDLLKDNSSQEVNDKKVAFVLADYETVNCILVAIGKPNQQSKHLNQLSKEDINKIHRRDLRTINQLWLSADNGKFGFSVQKSVWIDVCRESNHGNLTTYTQDTFSKFIRKVGWREDLFSFRDCGHLPLGLYRLGLELILRDSGYDNVSRYQNDLKEKESQKIEIEINLNLNNLNLNSMNDSEFMDRVQKEYRKKKEEWFVDYTWRTYEGKFNVFDLGRVEGVRDKIGDIYVELLSREDL